jgi:hypothetical protein
MRGVADLTDNEMWTIQSTLRERYGHDVEVELADSEIRLQPTDRELTTCPIAYWTHDDCNFVVIKTGEKSYRGQFFYRLHQQYGTGIDEYDDLAECMVSLLQAQADHERTRKQDSNA